MNLAAAARYARNIAAMTVAQIDAHIENEVKTRLNAALNELAFQKRLAASVTHIDAVKVLEHYERQVQQFEVMLAYWEIRRAVAAARETTPAPDAPAAAPVHNGDHDRAEFIQTDAVSYTDSHVNAGAFHRAISAARDIHAAHCWNGKTPVVIHDPDAMTRALAFGDVTPGGLAVWIDQGGAVNFALPKS